MVKFKYKTKIHNFFHLPKTGGTSISFFIQDKFEYDLVWKLYEKEFLDYVAEYAHKKKLILKNTSANIKLIVRAR